MKVPRLHSVCVVVELNVPDEPVELGVAAHVVGGAGEGGHLPGQDGAGPRQRDSTSRV